MCIGQKWKLSTGTCGVGIIFLILLFLLFINDITENLDFNALNNSDLELLSKYLILFADDKVFSKTSLESLQSQVDSLYQYSCKWGLEINIEKTKVCVFEKRKSFK